tara:strand:+ start:1471 stop:1644 length:174 start_codon:yes stop_codon:yes gene_type:complete
MYMNTISTPITINSLVIRAWKTDPNYQYEVGKVIEVKDNEWTTPHIRGCKGKMAKRI